MAVMSLLKCQNAEDAVKITGVVAGGEPSRVDDPARTK